MTSQDQKSNSPATATSANATNGRAAAGLLALELMHEIRNPLEALGHLTYLTREEAHDPEKVLKYMRLAEEHVGTLNRIASQTLGFARVSQNPRPIDLVALAEAALRIHQRTVEARNIHLVKRLPDDLLATVRGGQMLQVVSNLIVNALDALPDEGTLSVRLRKGKDGIHLMVADNGHGIAAEHLGRVFEPFFTTREESGNGLGLALSRKVIEEHGGRIRLRSSVREGRRGTMFKISLPLEG